MAGDRRKKRGLQGGNWTLRGGCAMTARMTEKPAKPVIAKPAKAPTDVRVARAKAALKANMAKRKAQAKARIEKG
jgi:hypothetical protein